MGLLTPGTWTWPETDGPRPDFSGAAPAGRAFAGGYPDFKGTRHIACSIRRWMRFLFHQQASPSRSVPDPERRRVRAALPTSLIAIFRAVWMQRNSKALREYLCQQSRRVCPPGAGRSACRLPHHAALGPRQRRDYWRSRLTLEPRFPITYGAHTLRLFDRHKGSRPPRSTGAGRDPGVRLTTPLLPLLLAAEQPL